MLWNGGSIAIKIPEGAKWASYKDESADLQFLQFTRFVKGGVINLYVHDANDSMIGRSIIANVELWRKMLTDGRSFLYIDLRPALGAREFTHQMLVKDGMTLNKAAFNTPGPLQGYVLFTASQPKDTAKKPAKPASTGDAQLDRLLAAGWQIDVTRTNNVTVFLYKGEGQSARHMTHHRPKKKK